jgi:hypothetical protein
MGKTTLFSRVALSPTGGNKGDKRESALSTGNKPNATKDSDYDTNASTMAGGTQQPLGKTLRSSTCTSTFKEILQKGVHSGVGILKK